MSERPLGSLSIDDVMGNGTDGDPYLSDKEISLVTPVPKKRGPKPGSTYKKKVVTAESLAQELKGRPPISKKRGRKPGFKVNKVEKPTVRAVREQIKQIKQIKIQAANNLGVGKAVNILKAEYAALDEQKRMLEGKMAYLDYLYEKISGVQQISLVN